MYCGLMLLKRTLKANMFLEVKLPDEIFCFTCYRAFPVFSFLKLEWSTVAIFMSNMFLCLMFNKT